MRFGFVGFIVLGAVTSVSAMAADANHGKELFLACAACHTSDPTAEGRHLKTGRAIEPMAVSVNPGRFTDPDEVEKQFGRDCKNVLGRPCTAQEKGDFITFLTGR